MIPAKVAFALYAVLAVAALATLKSTPLWIALVIVAGAAIKTLVDILRRRLDG